jgi:hypothetical protein
MQECVKTTEDSKIFFDGENEKFHAELNGTIF